MPAKRVKSKNYPAKTIAKAIAMMVAGESVQDVSDKLKVPRQTISEWKGQYPSAFGGIRPKKEIIEDLLGQYLEGMLRANIAQLKVFADESWIRAQTAGDMANLHGVVFDKAARIFDAARRAELERREIPPDRSIAGTLSGATEHQG